MKVHDPTQKAPRPDDLTAAAEALDEQIAKLHAAILYLVDELPTPWSVGVQRAEEICRAAVADLYEQTAYMRQRDLEIDGGAT